MLVIQLAESSFLQRLPIILRRPATVKKSFGFLIIFYHASLLKHPVALGLAQALAPTINTLSYRNNNTIIAEARMTKENNGRAARRLLIQRLSIVLASFLVCLGCLHILGIGKAAAAANNNRRGGGHNDKHIPHDILKDRSMVRRNGFARNTKEHHSSHNTNGPDIVHVTFDTSESTTTTADEIQLLLLNAQVHLVDIVSTDTDSPVTQNQIFGDFCTLNFAAHKKDPSAVPMFRHLVEASPHCAKVRYRVNLHDYMKHATLYDAKPKAATKALHLTAVVFHESRCGSTLVSNALVAMNPTKHRVYSESAPPIDALRTICGETYHSCTPKVASRILQQVVYAMSRTNDLREERVFFKIQSVGTRNIEVFQLAFPKVPFLFVYRDPVQVLMSQLSGVPGGTKNANCVRPRARPPASVVDLCQRKGIKKISDLSNEEYCAAHLVRMNVLSCF